MSSVIRSSFLLVGVLLALSGCRDQQPRSYLVPKEAAPTPNQAQPSEPSQSPPADIAADRAAMAGTTVPVATGNDLTWTAPSGWAEQPASGMRKGTLTLSGPEGTGDLSVTAFPDAVGGNLANVNRWRGQLGLNPISAAELRPLLMHIHVGPLHLDVIDIVGPRERMLVAIIPHAGATWFFRLLGPDALVGREKPTFMRFLQSIRPASDAS